MKRERTYTPEELEPYLIFCAELVDEEGPIMQPWLDRMEAEYAKAKARRDAGSQVDRIKALLAADKAPPPA